MPARGLQLDRVTVNGLSDVSRVPGRRRIAIVGAGVSGLVCAWLLRDQHDVTIFESEARPGGHSHTIEVKRWGCTLGVDTGFIVYNERNYPLFTKLLRQLGVETQASEMSFSVRCARTEYEYGGGSLGALFAQRRNIVSRAHYQMLRDILRFGREAPAAAAACADDFTLGEYLHAAGYSRAFVERYIVPMGSAIWSAPLGRMREFPFKAFVTFFDKHGMLRAKDRPQWRTVTGGSKQYVAALTAPFLNRLELSARVTHVRRTEQGVEVTAGGVARQFDEVILATHSDQALRLLGKSATALEKEILEAMPFQQNEAVLHTDAAMLPRKRRAWSAWNYYLPAQEPERALVTYNLSILQRLDTPAPLCVTLNEVDRVNPREIIARKTYHHPAYSAASFAAQARRAEIDGVDRVRFCGAYWGWGFHEDGVRSAVETCAALGAVL